MFIRSVFFFLMSMFCFGNFSYAAADSQDAAYSFFRNANPRIFDYISEYRRTNDMGLPHHETRHNAVDFNLTASENSEENIQHTPLELETSVVGVTQEQFYTEGSHASFNDRESFTFTSPGVRIVRLKVSKKTHRNVRAYFYRHSSEEGDRLKVRLEEEDNEETYDEIPTDRVGVFTFIIENRPIIGMDVFSNGFVLEVETKTNSI